MGLMSVDEVVAVNESFDRCARGIRGLKSNPQDRWARQGPSSFRRTTSDDPRRAFVLSTPEATPASTQTLAVDYKYSERLRVVVRIAVATQDLKVFVNGQEGTPLGSSLLFLVPQLVNKSGNPDRVKKFFEVWNADFREPDFQDKSRERSKRLGLALKLLQEEIIENGDEVAIALSKQRFNLLKNSEVIQWPQFMEADEKLGLPGFSRPTTSEGWDKIESVYLQRSVSALYKQIYSQI